MKKLSIAAFVLLVGMGVSQADVIDDYFANGVVDISWGMPIENVIAVTPPGDHVFSNAPGERSYWVKDGREFMSVPRRDQGILYSFDENDKLSSVTISYAYERRDQVMGALLSAFGKYKSNRTRGTRNTYSWQSANNVTLMLTASVEPKHGILWLTIASPRHSSYRRTPPNACEGKPDTRRK